MVIVFETIKVGRRFYSSGVRCCLWRNRLQMLQRNVGILLSPDAVFYFAKLESSATPQ